MTIKIPHALILAAGFGSRLKHITNSTPKCLVKVNGKTMLEYTIERLKCVTESIYINTHYLSEQVEKFVSLYPNNSNISIEHEHSLLGTGGSIKNVASKYNAKTLLVHNSDALFQGDSFIKDFINSYQGQEVFVALYPKDRLTALENGDFAVDTANKTAVLKKGGDYVYTGLAIFQTKAFLNKKESCFASPTIIAQAKDVGFYVIPHNVKWLDIGTPEKLAIANK